MRDLRSAGGGQLLIVFSNPLIPLYSSNLMSKCTALSLPSSAIFVPPQKQKKPQTQIFLLLQLLYRFRPWNTSLKSRAYASLCLRLWNAFYLQIINVFYCFRANHVVCCMKDVWIFSKQTDDSFRSWTATGLHHNSEQIWSFVNSFFKQCN